MMITLTPRSFPARPLRGLLLWAVLWYAVGCGVKESLVLPTGPPPEYHFIVDGEKTPISTLESVAFQSELLTPALIAITDKSVLEFLPLVRQESLTQRTMEVWLLSDGEEISLGAFPAYVSFVGGGLSSDVNALMGGVVRVDLARFAGRKVQFRWRLVDMQPGDKPEVALFKVYKKPPAAPPPHILFICSDTHRYDYALTPEGEELMPRLTEFRKESATYHHASSNATWTLPSIASTMSGKFPRFHVSGKRSKSISDPMDDAKIENIRGSFHMQWAKVVRYFTLFPSSGVTTFAGDLRDEGYFTSWVAGNIFYSMSGMSIHGMDVAVDARTKPGHEINALASSVITQLPTDRPNFLLVHYLDVHQYRLWYFDPKYPGQHPLSTDRENVLAAYRQSVRDSDRYLGELLDMWNRKFGFDNTMVVFYSDHGEHLRDPGYGSAEELAAGKGQSIEEFDLDIPLLDHGNSMDESLLHIPLVVRYPASMNLRGEFDDDVSLVDLYPTVLELSGASGGTDAQLDGESLLEIRRNNGKRKSPIHADYQLYGTEMSSIRDRNVKYVVTLDEADAVTSEHLVDTALPFTEKGEAGQRIENPGLMSDMERRFKDYVKASSKATRGLKSDELIDMENAAEGLGDAGYLKSRKK